MGLDQDAFVKIDEQSVGIADWRKHYPLQRAIVKLAGQDINCKDIELTSDMLDVIESARDSDDWYIDDDRYRFADQNFIVDARGYLKQGFRVYYYCSY